MHFRFTLSIRDIEELQLIARSKSAAELCAPGSSSSGTGAHTNNIQRGRYGRHRSNVWTYPGASSLNSDARKALAFHPTPKPLQMIKDILLDASRRGDAIFDGTAGSGTALLACEDMGRLYRGVEIDPIYVDVIVRRWQAQTGREVTLLATGETFTIVAKRRAASTPSFKAPGKSRIVLGSRG